MFIAEIFNFSERSVGIIVLNVITYLLSLQIIKLNDIIRIHVTMVDNILVNVITRTTIHSKKTGAGDSKVIVVAIEELPKCVIIHVHVAKYKSIFEKKHVKQNI